MFADGFRDRAEDHPGLGQFVLEGGADADAVEDSIDRDLAPFGRCALGALDPGRIICSFSGMPSFS